MEGAPRLREGSRGHGCLFFSIEGGVYSGVCGVVIWGKRQETKEGGWESVCWRSMDEGSAVYWRSMIRGLWWYTPSPCRAENTTGDQQLIVHLFPHLIPQPTHHILLIPSTPLTHRKGLPSRLPSVLHPLPAPQA
jgi:hypothetical protein